MSDLSGGGTGAPSPELARWVDEPFDRTELLTHNPSNAVTGGIWRAWRGDRTCVVKVLTSGHGHAGPTGWAASDDTHHFNYWRREVEAYREDLAQWFRPHGIDAPELLALTEPDEDTAVLWLEDVPGRSGGDVTVADLVELSRRLGGVQARLADGGAHAAVRIAPWLSRRFLPVYAETKYAPAVLDAALDDGAAWEHPRVRRWLGPLRDGLARLHRQRLDLYRLAAGCPQTLCHLDLWPNNVVVRPSGAFALVDWAFCGDGAMGEDVANLVPDSVFDLLLPHDVLDELARAAETAYIDGAREAGWRGDERWIRLGVRAAAAKYHWLFHRLVVDPDAPAMVYGGREVEPDELYAARSAGLALCTRWADEALTLAAALDV